jgi:hypothetical protein
MLLLSLIRNLGFYVRLSSNSTMDQDNQAFMLDARI